jgi:hypothetical protein
VVVLKNGPGSRVSLRPNPAHAVVTIRVRLLLKYWLWLDQVNQVRYEIPALFAFKTFSYCDIAFDGVVLRDLQAEQRRIHE